MPKAPRTLDTPRSATRNSATPKYSGHARLDSQKSTNHAHKFFVNSSNEGVTTHHSSAYWTPRGNILASHADLARPAIPMVSHAALCREIRKWISALLQESSVSPTGCGRTMLNQVRASGVYGRQPGTGRCADSLVSQDVWTDMCFVVVCGRPCFLGEWCLRCATAGRGRDAAGRVARVVDG